MGALAVGAPAFAQGPAAANWTTWAVIAVGLAVAFVVYHAINGLSHLFNQFHDRRAEKREDVLETARIGQSLTQKPLVRSLLSPVKAVQQMKEKSKALMLATAVRITGEEQPTTDMEYHKAVAVLMAA
jgi:hypothetical protein